MRDAVLLMEHPDHDPEERGDDGHDVAVRTPDVVRYGCLDKTCATAKTLARGDIAVRISWSP